MLSTLPKEFNSSRVKPLEKYDVVVPSSLPMDCSPEREVVELMEVDPEPIEISPSKTLTPAFANVADDSGLAQSTVKEKKLMDSESTSYVIATNLKPKTKKKLAATGFKAPATECAKDDDPKMLGLLQCSRCSITTLSRQGKFFAKCNKCKEYICLICGVQLMAEKCMKMHMVVHNLDKDSEVKPEHRHQNNILRKRKCANTDCSAIGSLYLAVANDPSIGKCKLCYHFQTMADNVLFEHHSEALDHIAQEKLSQMDVEVDDSGLGASGPTMSSASKSKKTPLAGKPSKEAEGPITSTPAPGKTKTVFPSSVTPKKPSRRSSKAKRDRSSGKK